MRRKFGLMAMMAVLVAVIVCLPAWGETIHPTKVVHPTNFGVTPAMRDITPLPPEKGLANREVPNREVSKLPVLPNASPSDQPQGEGRITAVSGVLAPSPAVAFDGLNSDTNASVVGFRVMPPDTEGAVGMNYYIQMINMVWAIYNKSDGSMAAGPFPLTQVWASGIPGTDCANYNDGDPVVLYDPLAQRWFMSQLAYEGSSYRNCLAVSQTGDPTGAWYVWQYTYSASTLNDYPKFGVWPDGYYMTVNEFGSGDPATTVFDRTAMLAGDANPAAQYFYIAGVQPAFPLPTNFEGGDPPPAGSPNYNIAFYDDAWGNPADILQICTFHVDWTTPANSTFDCPPGAGDPGYIDLTAAGLSFDSDLCGYGRDCIPQPNGQSVDTLCDRLMFPANYRNLMATKGYEVMTVTHSVDVDGSDHAGVRWYELHNTGAGWFIYDGGSFAPDSDDRWMGSSSVDQEGNIGIMYSISSSTTYPSVGYTGRLATDPAGTMQSEQLVVAGGGSQSGGNRWGDYAAMHVDPPGCSFWGTAEYVNTGGNFIWDTYVASFSMPGCTPAGYGTIDGTVTSSGSGLPIAGALVQVGALSTYTQADGTYAMNVMANTYDVTASAFGYDPQTVTGVVVPDGGSVTQDFALDPVGVASVDGYVVDAGGEDWPLYAKVEVQFNSTTVATVFTNPVTGYYELELPHSTPYDFIVTPVYPGYEPQTRMVTPPPAGATENFQFMPDSSCSAPGYMLLSTGVDESFEGAFPPPGWTVVNHGGSCDWNTTTYYARTNYAGGSGMAADADSDRCGSSSTMNTSLYTPIMDLTGVASPTLDYIGAYNYLSGDYLDVNISSDGGSTWTNLLHWNSGHSAYGPGEAVSLDVSAYATATTQVEFHFYAPGWDWWAEVDDVAIGNPSASCLAMPGALMVGNVTDANTGEGLNGASVMDDLGDSATTMATPDDPAIGDGFYFLFAQLPGIAGPSTRTFTASATGYGMQQVQMNPQPSAANMLDFALDAGWLEMSPEHMEMRLNAGLTADEPMSILNHGGLPATVQMVAFETAGWVPNLPMDEIAAPAVAPEHLNDRNSKSVTVPERKPSAPLAAGDVIQTWPTGLSLPWGVGFDQFGDKVWLADPYVPTTDYEYQTDGTATGNTIDLSSWVGSWAGDMAFDPVNYKLWQVNVGGDNCIHELDPVTLTSTGNSICWGASTSERGVAYDQVSDTFFVGGWNTLAITRFDRAGNVLQVANVGLSISGLAYNPLTGHLFVLENSPTDTVTVMDVNDNYNVVGSFTVAGFGNYVGAGIEFDCNGHLWMANQGDHDAYEVDSGESASCLGASLPWMELTPDSGVVPAASGGTPGEMVVNAHFIADGAPHWGLVQGTVILMHDTPYQVNDLSVCFTKAFSDVAEGAFADARIHSVAGARITTGCGGGNFCPTDVMTRGVMARWMINAMHGPDYSPPPCTGIFADVPCETTPNSDYIEALYNDGVTAGCSADPLLYCPNSAISRSQMAVFLLKAKLGSDYTPPACTGIFDDVACPGGFAVNWIEDLYNRGVTAGCTATSFCPNASTGRNQMAVFVSKNWNLPMCQAPMAPTN